LLYASFRSIGAYVPEKNLSNKDLEKMVDTSDEWITKRSGIKNRHIAADDQAASDLAKEAALVALERAGMTAQDLDMIIVASISGDYLFMPSTACVLADKLGVKNIPAFDVLAACTGFIYALATAKAFIESGMKKNILIVGAEALSKFVDYSDRTTCVLFGDGAGAAVISATENKDEAIMDIHISADGTYQDFLITPGGGSKNPCSDYVQKEHLNFMKMKGNETFKVAVRTLSGDVKDILENNPIELEDVKFFIPHQANYRIIKAVGDAIGVDDEQLVLTVDKFGNTSAASIPMAMNYIYEEGKLKNGDMMLLDAFGGGLTWGSALVPFCGK
jgi:3-oxoacyl-[acyl-carrier-protein] synthase-3